MMAPSRLRWGVVGCANFARSVAVPAMLEAESVEIVGVASRDREKAEQFRQEFGLPKAYGSYEELLDDSMVEAVYIPLPNGLHAPWTIKALAAGKHVLCEKPFSANVNEAIAAAAAARQAKRQVMEGFMWRFHPQHERALQLVSDGAVGTVKQVRATFSFTMSRQPNVRWDPQLAGGAIADVGCYTVSAARTYFASEPTSVVARATVDPETGVDISMGAVLDFPSGRAILDCAFDLPFRSGIEVVGDRGVLEIPSPWLPGERPGLVLNGEREDISPANQYVLEFDHFSRCVLDNQPARYGAEDAVRQMRVLDAIVRSCRTGRQETV